jgi:tRNA threonylcarbamoyladenosine modification (KEOPS) complex  Pcc1 subunit
MKSEVRIDSMEADTLEEVVKPSLQSEGRVSVEVDSTDNELVTRIETDSLGALRGSTDNVFRLTSLAKKIYET